MANISAQAIKPDMKIDDPPHHIFKHGNDRILQFKVDVDGALGGETIWVTVQNLKGQTESKSGVLSRPDPQLPAATTTVVFPGEKDGEGGGNEGPPPQYIHLGTGPDTLTATVVAPGTVSGVPTPYTYNTV